MFARRLPMIECLLFFADTLKLLSSLTWTRITFWLSLMAAVKNAPSRMGSKKTYIKLLYISFPSPSLMTKEWVIEMIFDKQIRYRFFDVRILFSHSWVSEKSNNRRQIPYLLAPMYYSLFLFLFSFLDRLSKCIIFKPQRKLKALGLFLRPFLKWV